MKRIKKSIILFLMFLSFDCFYCNSVIAVPTLNPMVHYTAPINAGSVHSNKHSQEEYEPMEKEWQDKNNKKAKIIRPVLITITILLFILSILFKKEMVTSTFIAFLIITIVFIIVS